MGLHNSRTWQGQGTRVKLEHEGGTERLTGKEDISAGFLDLRRSSGLLQTRRCSGTLPARLGDDSSSTSCSDALSSRSPDLKSLPKMLPSDAYDLILCPPSDRQWRRSEQVASFPFLLSASMTFDLITHFHFTPLPYHLLFYFNP